LDGLRGGGEPASASIVRTRSGALVIVYLDSTTYNFSWDNTINQPNDDCRLEVWAIRSLDGGQTWIDRQRILDGYNPNFFGFIQTRGGRLVATVPHLVRDPGRYVACSLTSDDDGALGRCPWNRLSTVPPRRGLIRIVVRRGPIGPVVRRLGLRRVHEPLGFFDALGTCRGPRFRRAGVERVGGIASLGGGATVRHFGGRCPSFGREAARW
jgi:hypothetical protein